MLVTSAFCLPQLLAQDTEPAKGAPNDLKRLQGGWAMVAAENEGQKVPGAGRWVFKESQLLAGYTADKLETAGTVKVNSSKTPKHIDLIATEGRWKDKTMPGIFKLEENRLIICLGVWDSAERPSEFIAPPGSGWTLLIFERIKK
jgi:uncharacterized protein (TIGR03067 family)